MSFRAKCNEVEESLVLKKRSLHALRLVGMTISNNLQFYFTATISISIKALSGNAATAKAARAGL